MASTTRPPEAPLRRPCSLLLVNTARRLRMARMQERPHGLTPRQYGFYIETRGARHDDTLAQARDCFPSGNTCISRPGDPRLGFHRRFLLASGTDRAHRGAVPARRRGA